MPPILPEIVPAPPKEIVPAEELVESTVPVIVPPAREIVAALPAKSALPVRLFAASAKVPVFVNATVEVTFPPGVNVPEAIEILVALTVEEVVNDALDDNVIEVRLLLLPIAPVILEVPEDKVIIPPEELVESTEPVIVPPAREIVAALPAKSALPVRVFAPRVRVPVFVNATVEVTAPPGVNVPEAIEILVALTVEEVVNDALDDNVIEVRLLLLPIAPVILEVPEDKVIIPPEELVESTEPVIVPPVREIVPLLPAKSTLLVRVLEFIPRVPLAVKLVFVAVRFAPKVVVPSPT